jgi:hypothetical protein
MELFFEVNLIFRLMDEPQRRRLKVGNENGADRIEFEGLNIIKENHPTVVVLISSFHPQRLLAIPWAFRWHEKRRLY